MAWLTGAGRRRPGRAVHGPARAGLLLLAALLVIGCSQQGPPSTGAATARLADCGGSPQVRPSVVVVLCADSGITAHGLRWAGWGAPVATATGTAVVNVCEYSDCHTGSYRSYPIVLVLSRLLTCPGRTKAYGRLQYLFAGPQPFREGSPAPGKPAPRAMVTGGTASVPGLGSGPSTVPGMTGPGCG